MSGRDPSARSGQARAVVKSMTIPAALSLLDSERDTCVAPSPEDDHGTVERRGTGSARRRPAGRYDIKKAAWRDDRFAALKTDYEQCGRDPSNLRYGYVVPS
jgi:hypothetical protein